LFGLFIDGVWIFLLPDGLQSLELEERSIEAVLKSTFVHDKPVEDPCMSKIIYCNVTESEVELPWLRLSMAWQVTELGAFFFQSIYGQVMDCASALQPPGEADNPLCEHIFNSA